MDWGAIVTAVILSVLSSSGLFRLWIRHRFNRNLVKYEADLKRTHDKEVESLKADLRVAAYERETRYHVLQSKRAKVIAHIYTLLGQANRALGDFVKVTEDAGGPLDVTRGRTAAAAIDEFAQDFDDNRIYFPESICDRMDRFIQQQAAAHDEYGLRLPDEDGPTITDDAFARMDKGWREAFRQVQTDIPPLRREIEQHFRGLLGVEEPEEEQEGQV